MPSKTITKPIKITKINKRKKEIVQTFIANNKDIDTQVYYPISQKERESFINPKTGKVVTPFQYKVYDLVAQVPKGQVTSYKVLSDTLKSAPRAVGQALRLNPFCPLPVPCHRVIASDLTIGGFSGSFGDSQFVANKKAMLELEGCSFNENYVFKNNVDGSQIMFKDFK
ncbi:DNA binding methylated-DNA--cysteine S-methyltransferase [Rhizopus microsporus var. microsporus]|uniref:Methylated-DNA--protein-cysteine methyltransferase n=2 Tax=Rhizopus microsporus TaxID=58291 RepID=A0A2G4SY02_RHIZD|nr:DNA binding methylated-DNA--cysteine S-methyltransferase [Rhizopus microsporus ATCC 52813]ORE07949.1 DNA binding methylated-DNA--cysteine S-methyltransferase [Rhizopus microsporus var. microsporus]PHZ13625.1 DNA binding methylated-DNA--cysteine S-methyltransferase [Rhizopus microsporus ATCC 52813]